MRTMKSFIRSPASAAGESTAYNTQHRINLFIHFPVSSRNGFDDSIFKAKVKVKARLVSFEAKATK